MIVLRLCLLIVLGVCAASAESALWLRYSAISPDGQKVAFTYKGDIYIAPTSGGSAVALTQHVAYDYAPVWSPDGTWLAFASDRHGNDDVYRISAKGGKATRLTYHSKKDVPMEITTDGSKVLFQSVRLDSPVSLDMPNRKMPELYQVSAEGGKVTQLLTTPVEAAALDKSGKRMLYHDKKGYEDDWRKHHTSSVTRDVWLYDSQTQTHRKLTSFEGEDRNPIWWGGDNYLYLSEKSGSFNVWKASLDGKSVEQVTQFEKHPVRFLSRSDKGMLCYGYNGEIYVQRSLKDKPEKLEILIGADDKQNNSQISFGKEVKEFALSPDETEIAFIARGEVFVTKADYSETRRITTTAQQERSVSFHPDGRKLIYASERNGSWNLYTTEIVRDEEESFALSTILKEEVLLKVAAETFQPAYSPDGKSVAFLEERTQLKVLDVKSGKVRTLLDGKRGYSYSDGDIEFAWSPNSKYLLSSYLPEGRWVDDIAMVRADGKGEPVNLSLSGYYNMNPQWAWNGEAVTWISNRHGMKSHGSWGSDTDVYAAFLTENAHRLFELSEVDREKIDEEAWKKIFEKDRAPELEAVQYRKERLTIQSTSLQAAVVSPDAKSLYYMSEERGDSQIWVHHFYTDETKVLTTLSGGGDDAADLVIDEKGEKLFALSSGQLYSIDIKAGSSEKIAFKAEMTLDRAAEREEMFEHVWRQVKKKFYRKDLHGVDWEFYKKEYKAFLPHINNNTDFSEMLSELLGELNASHTGSGYRPKRGTGDQTASLGIYHDSDYRGKGIKILEVIDRGPLDVLEKTVPSGAIIEKMNGQEIKADENHFRLLNRVSGQRVLLSFYDPATKKSWEAVVKPISQGEEAELVYRRWIKRQRAYVEKLSGGKLGYVHVRQMNDEGFRQVYNDVLGRYCNKQALVVDTRFNGGGWLSEDLTTFLSGKDFLKFYPREQTGMGGEPMFRWTRPSVVVMGESNYSDAHIFPYAYKTLNIGKLIGMPVPGTGTAVWWETLNDSSLYFGIPQVSTIDTKGRYLENTQLEPDILVMNSPEDRAKGVDRQIQSAVKHLLGLPETKPWIFPKH